MSKGTTPETLTLFFDRPNEPSYFPKGNNLYFDVPQDYLRNRSKVASGLVSRAGSRPINVKKVDLPDLSLPLQLGRDENFSTFIPYHREMAGRLIDVLMGMRTLDDLCSACTYCAENINPVLFIYALSVVMLHRPDTKNTPVPSLAQVFPSKFIGKKFVAQAIQESNIFPTNEAKIPLEIPLDYTASDLDPEHRLAYFREDLGINLHHWHWKLVYPFSGPDSIVRKDRRGEIFYYMHQQIIARYNFERFCNKLGRTQRFHDLRQQIPEGYFPKLDNLNSSRNWPPRQPNSYLSDVKHEQVRMRFDIQDLERWTSRIFDAIHNGRVINAKGEAQPLTEYEGIDILGNIVESNPLSINRNFYGDMHNLVHAAVSLIHDPDYRHLETFGVMADPAVAMRDPMFYRHHARIDDIFQEHKKTLPPYGLDKLSYDGITIASVAVATQNGPKNTFLTTYAKDDINLTRGLDFTPRGPIFARITHLQHSPFLYNIDVNNTGAARKGTVRIFLAPKFDERGIPLIFRDQRILFIELDRFVVDLKAGANKISRKSTESSVTIPFEQIFRDISVQPDTTTPAGQAFNYCGCGWPHHLLIPKGTPEGFPCEMFVMVSNYADDKVNQKLDDVKQCDDASSYCGIRDKLYPDKRPMGFPFDRLPRQGADTLARFINNVSNMKVIDVIIQFTGPGNKRVGSA